MSFFGSLDIAASGLTAERLRMDVTAENLANAQTTRGANGQPYQRQEVVLQQVGGFGASLAGAMGSSASGASPSGTGYAGGSSAGASYSDPSSAGGSSPAGGPTPGGVEVAGIVADPTPDRLVYDPTNPDANAQGYVRMPNVNTVTEMVDLIDESRSYQADVTAMQTAKTMYTKTLDVLK